MTMKLIAPAGMQQFQDGNGTTWTPDSNGQITVDPTQINVGQFLAAGFAEVPDVAGSNRPIVTFPGMMYFDTTLNSGAGLPIWRNAANTGWINAAGASV